ncbi:DUF2945 domain-containing protein [Sphingomonas sp. R-74633]|uniref:DUF2945 domain-containing protein n=1 Tax=Sphingomonas sp. R-74633 TaxID=2751188 RepID=UPI0015D108A3|nr:DUF2945 domain-containing protein [Sphingomonas sp. R-74633]NYT39330.1 DUF2945 domain-containing protein [Sphingomonas sp. R-74633]
MRNSFRKGAKVHWTWADDTAHGKIEERFERRVQRTFKGTKVARNGSPENPAYLIVQEDGTKLLKLGRELTAD